MFAIALRHQPAFDSDSWNGSGKSRQYQDRFPAEGSLQKQPLRSFKVPDSLHLTHDVAIPHDVPAWTQEDTELLDTTIGYNLKTQMLKQEYGKKEDLTGHRERINFSELSRAERLYKALWNHVYPIYQELPGRDREREKALVQLAKTRPDIDFFLRLEKRLFPWIHFARQSSFSLYRSYSGRGLVFCAGNGQFEFVVTSIQAIRNRLKSTLPIQVFHMGDNDLSPGRQVYLRAMEANIEVIDVTQILDNDYMQLGGWSIKPFAMLASSFEEVMFVDADAYFLQDPVVLFDDPGYQAAGALFFYDRTLFPNYGDGADWLKSVTPMLSSFPPQSRMFRRLSAHEQESGVVLINKKARFLGLLATCKSNGKWERDLVSYKVFHGDKETFWTGFELIQEPYVFMRNYGGVIGELRPDNDQSVCGAQLHEDFRGRPLWWNGGLYRNKNEGITRYLTFGYWMSGGGHQKHRERYTNDPEEMKEVLSELGLHSQDQLRLEPKDAEWDFKESCLAGARVNSLTQREKDLANGYIGIDRIAREDSRKMDAGEALDPNVHDWDNAK
ncbi:hypothetical protein BGZ99_009599 [Dissophora globulifera]|uniref:Glycosyltransferase family 71 protein n=1 Tax=Dissophora globulifera TaxID=979702 RepID=A0A9P6UN09_9FUNG|nr:hypothetical protein BGZ99_009599 [Dissophora globulifera]